MVMDHEVDPRAALLAKLGNLSGLELFNNQVLVALYIRPEKTRSGIILADSTRDEDKSQGKVGLVIAMGPNAFKDPDEKWFEGVQIELGEWVYYRASDGWSVTIDGVPCRVFDDMSVRGRIQHPDQVW